MLASPSTPTPGILFSLHALCVLQVNVFVYLASDFCYLRHLSFAWWPKLTEHIQELGIKKLIRKEKSN